jgi:hypothetical protein
VGLKLEPLNVGRRIIKAESADTTLAGCGLSQFGSVLNRSNFKDSLHQISHFKPNFASKLKPDPFHLVTRPPSVSLKLNSTNACHSLRPQSSVAVVDGGSDGDGGAAAPGGGSLTRRADYVWSEKYEMHMHFSLAYAHERFFVVGYCAVLHAFTFH